MIVLNCDFCDGCDNQDVLGNGETILNVSKKCLPKPKTSSDRWI